VERLSVRSQGFAEAGYVLLPGLLSQNVCSFLYEYVLKSARAGRFGTGDSGVPGTPNCYGDPFTESLLELLLPRVESESGRHLFPTYSYLRLYKCGDVLHRHRDRPSCEISVTLNLGYEAAAPWPICVEAGGVTSSLLLEPSDALLYKGIEVPHWRESFPGEHSAQVFLHYVDKDGPHKEFKYDRRLSLSTSPACTQLLDQLTRIGTGV